MHTPMRGNFFNLVNKPGRFFAHALLQQKVGTASAFMLIVVAVFSVLRMITDSSLSPDLIPSTFARYDIAFSVAAMALNCVYALVISLIGKRIGGKATFKRVFIVGAYSCAPLVLLGTTYTSIIGIIWAYCLSVCGLKVAHGLPTKSAAALQAGFVAVCALVVGLLLATFLHHKKNNYPANVLTGKPAPNVVLKRFDGTEVKLVDLKGKVILLDFWATWCTPCRHSLSILSDLSKEFRPLGLEAFAIADDDAHDATDYLHAYKIDLGGVQGTTELDRAFFVEALPESIVIDRKGLVHAVHVGTSPEEIAEVRDEIKRCLSEHF